MTKAKKEDPRHRIRKAFKPRPGHRYVVVVHLGGRRKTCFICSAIDVVGRIAPYSEQYQVVVRELDKEKSYVGKPRLFPRDAITGMQDVNELLEELTTEMAELVMEQSSYDLLAAPRFHGQRKKALERSGQQIAMFRPKKSKGRVRRRQHKGRR